MKVNTSKVVVAWLIAARAAAQTPGDVRSANGLHTATFQTSRGSIAVLLPDDAAPGDTISGVVIAEPSGGTQQEKDANLGELNGYVVDLEGQRKPAAEKKYEWTIPATIRTGLVTLRLRDPGGSVVSQCTVPVEAVPAVQLPQLQPPAPAAFEIPKEGAAGKPATIRGPVGGTFAGESVRVGSNEADLLASSPRKLVFRVPAGAAGPLPVQFRRGDQTVEGSMRAIGVRLTATSLMLERGQRAALTGTVSGLQNITEPVTLTLVNNSPAVVRLQGGGTQTRTIQPSDVQPGGTFVIARDLTGLLAGAFNISLSARARPLAQFDVPRTIDRALTNWEAVNRIGITTEARELMQRGVLDQQKRLDDFLRQQQIFEGEPATVLGLLISQYCFDLRDRKPQGTPRGRGPQGFAAFRTAFLQGQPSASGPGEITASDVRGFSFAQFLSTLLARLASSQAVGYLDIRSMPDQAAITIDSQHRNEMTNRVFLASVGVHAVEVAGALKKCQNRASVQAFEKTVVVCDQ